MDYLNKARFAGILPLAQKTYQQDCSMVNLPRYFFAVILLIFSNSVAARNYDLELIVFERTNLSSNIQELWSTGSNQGMVHQESLRDLASRSVKFAIQPGVSRLKNVEANLLQSGYRVLQSARWTQSAEVFQRAPIISVGSSDRLRGFIKVYKTSLIFVDLSLALHDVFIEPQIPTYFINEKRRLKFKEVHFFDHPKFGAIVTVWPGG